MCVIINNIPNFLKVEFADDENKFVKAAYATTDTGSDLDADEFLLDMIMNGGMDRLRSTLWHLFELDKLAAENSYSLQLLRSVEDAVKKVYESEVQATGGDFLRVLNQGNGLLLNSYQRLGVSIVYFIPHRQLLNLKESQTLLDKQTFQRYECHFLTIGLERSETISAFISDKVPSYFDVQDHPNVSKNTRVSALFAAIPMAYPMNGFSTQENLVFVLYLSNPLIVTEHTLASISRMVGSKFLSNAMDTDDIQYLCLEEALLYESTEIFMSRCQQQLIRQWQTPANGTSLELKSSTTGAYRIKKITFTHPSVIGPVVALLRAQQTFNQLYASCFEFGSSVDGDNLNICTVQVIDHMKIQVTCGTSVEFTVQVSAAGLVVVTGPAHTSAFNADRITTALQTCASIPLLIDWLMK